MTEVSFSHDVYIPFSRIVTLSGMVMVSSLIQTLNAKVPMEVTLSGIVRDSNSREFKNASVPIVVIPSGIITDVRLENANANSPIEVTGMVSLTI